jgi:hypothetical protein
MGTVSRIINARNKFVNTAAKFENPSSTFVLRSANSNDPLSAIRSRSRDPGQKLLHPTTNDHRRAG